MIIIIEGMDNTGKTTLINQLREVYTNSAVIHSSKPPNSVKNKCEWETSYYYQMSEMSVQANMNMIFDRFHLGTYVYGIQFRGYLDDEVSELFDLVETSLMSTDKPVFLITLVDYGDAIMNRDDSLSFEKTADDYDATKRLFEEAHDKSSIVPKLLINISDNGGLGNTFKTVKEFIDGNR